MQVKVIIRLLSNIRMSLWGLILRRRGRILSWEQSSFPIVGVSIEVFLVIISAPVTF